MNKILWPKKTSGFIFVDRLDHTFRLLLWEETGLPKLQFLGRYPRHWDIFKSSMVEDRNLILMAVAMPMWEILDHAPHGPFLHRNLACPKRWVDNRIPLFFNLLGWSTLTLDRLDSTSWKESLLQAGRFPSQSKYFGLRLRIPKNRKPELSGRNVHTMPTTQDHFTWRESAKRKTHACQERHAQDSCASTRRTPTTRWGKRGWGVWERNEDDSRDWNKWHESGGEMLQFDYNIFEMGWFNHQLGHEWFPVH